MSPRSKSDAERLVEKIGPVDPLTGCRLWTAAGGFWSSTKSRLVSPRRAAWELETGEDVGEGFILRARCENKECVEPTHMERVAKGVRTSTHCSHGHEISEENGHWAKDGTWVCRPCKREQQRRYRQDPEFRARQAAYSRNYAHSHPERMRRKAERQRERYREDPEYRERVRERARRNRARKQQMRQAGDDSSS